MLRLTARLLAAAGFVVVLLLGGVGVAAGCYLAGVLLWSWAWRVLAADTTKRPLPAEAGRGLVPGWRRG